MSMTTIYRNSFADTNVVLRYLTGEPRDQAREAVRLIENMEESIEITDVVINETAYVLRTQYRFSREQIIDGLISLIRRNNISVYAIDKDFVLQGLRMCRPSGRVSIADAMIWAAARSSGARVIYTFDRRFPGEGIELRRSL